MINYYKNLLVTIINYINNPSIAYKYFINFIIKSIMVISIKKKLINKCSLKFYNSIKLISII
jgi:hypothetical protein